jgi:hypothetical protein
MKENPKTNLLSGSVGDERGYGTLSWALSRRAWVRSVAATAGYGLISHPSPAQEVRAIGTQKQLFIDDYVIDELQNVKKVLNPVKKHPGNPILVPEYPWEFKEDFTWDGASVLYNAERQEFQLWYGVVSTRVCYATSKDGLHWEKPRLGRVSFRGAKENNIVVDGSQPSVIYRPDASPERRYTLQLNALWQESSRRMIRGATFFSADGIRWTPASTASLDMADSSYTFFDPYSKRYVLVSKQSTRMGKLPCPTCAQMFIPDRRTLSIAFSQDFRRWSALEPLLIPDARDDEMAKERAPLVAMLPPLDDDGDWIYGYPMERRQQWREQLHRSLLKPVFRRTGLPPAAGGYQRTDFMDMPVLPYEGLYIGLLWCLTITAPAPHYGWAWAAGSEFHGGHDGIMESQLAVSRDLRHWERCGERLPIIPVGDSDDAWDSCMIFPCNGPLVVGDEIWCYYGGSNFTHMDRLMWDRRKKYPEKRQAIGLGKLRLDGFMSVDASDEGSLTTKLLTFRGHEMIVNVSAPEGQVGVEILDAQRQPITGFSRNDCDLISGDDLRRVVRWRGSEHILQVSEKPVHLRFYLKHAKMYSFQFRA